MTTRWVLYRLIPKIAAVSVVLGLAMLLYTEAGLRWLWSIAEPRLPAGIEIASVNGRLLDKVVIKGLRIDTPGLKLSVDKAWVDWRPSALFGFTLHINEIVAIGIDGQALPVDGAPPADSQGGLPERLPRLPTVIVDAVKVGNAVWRQADGTPTVELRRARLAARVGGDGVWLRLSELDLMDRGRYTLALDGDVAPARVRIDSLEFGGPGGLELSAQGSCDWPSLNCQLATRHRNLGWPLVQPQWRSPEGRVEFAGTPDSYQVQADLDLVGPELPPQALAIQLAGSTTALEHFKLGARSLAGRLEAEGALRWDDGIRVDGSLALFDYDLATWDKNWNSRLTGGGKFRVAYGEVLRVEAPGFHIQGSLRDESIDLRADVATRDRTVEVSGLALDWANTRVRGTLSVGETLSAALNVEAPALERLEPRARGALNANVKVAGTVSTPHVKGRLKGTSLGYDAIRVQDLDADFDLHWQGGGRSVAHMRVSGVEAGGPPIESAGLTLDGRFDAFTAQWKVGTARLDASGGLRGRIDPASGNARLRIEALDLRMDTVGQWALSGPATLVRRGSDLDLGRLCMSGDGSELCAQGKLEGESVQGRLELTPVALSRFKALWPVTTRVDGSVSARVDIPASPISNPNADVRVELTPLTVSSVDRRETIEVLKLAAGRIDARLRDRRLVGSLKLPGIEDGGLSGQFSVDEQSIDGRVAVDIRDLEVLTLLNPEIVEIDGAIKGTLTVAGSPREPQLGGQLGLNARSLVLDTPNIELQDLALTIRGRGRADLALEGRARSGDGSLALSGGLDWSGTWPAVDGRLSGDNFLASNTDVARVRVSPDLRLKLRERRLDVGGSVHVPMAHINVKDIESNGRVSPSGDEFVVGEDDEEPAIVVRTDVRLSLGNDVRFSGFGLKTRITGKLRTQSASGSIATATGELQLVEGRYKAYGQNLVIERGRLLFTGGAISEPGLDFRAYRQARADIRAGVQVRGSLRAPEFTLYSHPAMRETDQLSYLVLGRAAEAQSESDQAALNNAALALGLQGGDFLAQKVKGRFGLDDVKIGAQPGESADQAALILGKYLTPDLYVSYGIGLFEPTYEFRMRYRLTDRWLLQTESGVESGGDIFYTIER